MNSYPPCVEHHVAKFQVSVDDILLWGGRGCVHTGSNKGQLQNKEWVGGWQTNSVQPLVSGRPVLSFLAGEKIPCLHCNCHRKQSCLPYTGRESFSSLGSWQHSIIFLANCYSLLPQGSTIPSLQSPALERRPGMRLLTRGVEARGGESRHTMYNVSFIAHEKKQKHFFLISLSNTSRSVHKTRTSHD